MLAALLTMRCKNDREQTCSRRAQLHKADAMGSWRQLQLGQDVSLTQDLLHHLLQSSSRLSLWQEGDCCSQ